MLFTLEALRAKHGDALLLHFGDAASPGLIVIDGGPSGVFKASLKPRLIQLQKARSATLPVDLAMVSHIDDDHINGFLAWIESLGKPGATNCDVREVWHNSFDDIVGSAETANAIVAAVKPAMTAALGNAGSAAGMHLHSALVLASVAQGRNLRIALKNQALTVNAGFPSGLVAVQPGQPVTKKKLGNLTLTVLGPRQDRVNALRIEWAKKLQEMGVAVTAAFTDESVFNLSSIIVLAESRGKSMLLTGDARGDDILAVLRDSQLFKAGKFRCTLLKIPHHGSDHNVSTEFFRRVVADHYVFSGDGKHDNPELSTLQMLLDARPGEKYSVHFTYPEARVKAFYKQRKTAAKGVTVDFLADNELGLKVNLGQKLAF